MHLLVITGDNCLPQKITPQPQNVQSAVCYPLRETIAPEELELISRGKICGYPLHLHVFMPIIETNPQSQLGSHVTVS